MAQAGHEPTADAARICEIPRTGAREDAARSDDWPGASGGALSPVDQHRPRPVPGASSGDPAGGVLRRGRPRRLPGLARAGGRVVASARRRLGRPPERRGRGGAGFRRAGPRRRHGLPGDHSGPGRASLHGFVPQGRRFRADRGRRLLPCRHTEDSARPLPFGSLVKPFHPRRPPRRLP
jgi:hypothetical protein